MRQRALLDKLGRFFRTVYLKLFRINDTPQKIAIGMGIGVLSGVFPGTGPVAALFLAFIFRVNRASALLGSIVTNTWMSIPVFLISVKVGALITGLNYHDIHSQWGIFVKEFRWEQLLSLSMLQIIGPIVIGYIVVSIAIGALTYVLTLAAVYYFKTAPGKQKK